MATEIERKFLIKAPPEWIDRYPEVQINQGYLAVTDEVEVRLRQAGTATLLTVKGGIGDVRQEAEIELDSEVFEALWPLTEGRRLVKVRRRVPLEDGLTAEVDFFQGALGGLIVAEVEFDSEAAEQDFDPPTWLGEELTGDQRYANQSLATQASPPGACSGGFPYRLKRKETVSDGTRRIACGQIERALRQLEEGGAADDAVIHGVRKDLKKLRAVLRLVRAGLGEEFFVAQNKRFRDAGRLLSDARDAEVKLATLAALIERFGSELPQPQVEAWRLELEGERERVKEGSSSGSRSQMHKAKELIAAGGVDCAEWPLEGDGWRQLEAGLLRSYREAGKAMYRARSSRAAGDVHQWRKRSKDLWYQLRLLRGIWKPVMGELADQNHQLVDLLGDHHDLTLLMEDLQGRPGISKRRRIGELIERRQGELLGGALALGALLFAEKPKAFRRRLRVYWFAWR